MTDPHGRAAPFRGITTCILVGSWATSRPSSAGCRRGTSSRTLAHVLRRRRESPPLRVAAAVLWAPVGNLLVMNYVCVAWPLHLAVANLFGVEALV